MSDSKKEDFDKGVEFRVKMYGEDQRAAATATPDDFMAPLSDYVTRICFGETWTRPGLDAKTRSLISIGITVGLGREMPFKNMVRGAIGNGATKEEIRETLYHSLIYLGVASAAQAWGWAAAVLKEMDAY
jgi:4-carboxymuconolactone decarboxylase